jgi:DNA-binding NtrC family response regulator
VPPTKAEGIVQLPGISDAIRTLNRRIREFAAEDGMVFITGEPGTEKALGARTIHMSSTRAERPISKISVSWKLPADTAARFRACDKGSLIVNLQREFPVDMQYTVLEMANDKAFADAMSGDLVEADVRILLTTSLSLDKLNGNSSLLPELNDLLGRCHLEIPPIRERPEDIPALVRYATQRAIETGRSRAVGANPQVLHLFRQWHWPGNAEDLLLVTAEAALNSSGNVITLDDLPSEFIKQIPPGLVETAREVKMTGSRSISTAEEDTGSSSDEVRIDPAPPMSVAFHQTPAKPEPKSVPPKKQAVIAGDLHEEKTDPVMGSLIEEIEARRRAKEQPEPPEEEITAPDLQELAAAAQRELAAIKANEAADLKSPEEVEQQTRRLQRLFILARRLNAQSQILARQMSGPLRHRRVDVGYSTHESEQDSGQLSEALETELDKGLDAILALRRQLAILNQREIQAHLTARDLYRRLILAGQDIRRAVEDDEIKGEATIFSNQLKAVEEAISRIRASFPDIEPPSSPKDPTEELRRDEIEQVQRILRDAEKEG